MKNSRQETAEMVTTARQIIRHGVARSAWERGVKAYALDLLDTLEEGAWGGWIDPEDLCSPRLLARALLNGASDWEEYSSGGCALIYDADIAERLCTPSELKKTHNGQRRPNARETWIDTQARALFQASNLIKDTFRDFSI